MFRALHIMPQECRARFLAQILKARSYVYASGLFASAQSPLDMNQKSPVTWSACWPHGLLLAKLVQIPIRILYMLYITCASTCSTVSGLAVIRCLKVLRAISRRAIGHSCR